MQSTQIRDPEEKSPPADEPQSDHVEQTLTIEIDNYQGITWNCIVVYVALLSVGFAQMMILISSGSLAQHMVADIGGKNKLMWMPQTVTIVNLALGPTVAQLADYWGRKWPIVICCAIAIAGSLILSRADNIDMALAGNIIASFAMAAQPLIYAVASEIFPRKYRPLAQGGLSGIFALAAVIGLMMGSALVKNDPAGWRVVWYFNTGLFAFSTLITLFFYNPPLRTLQRTLSLHQKLYQLDWVAIGLIPLSVTLFAMGLTWADNPYPWTDRHVLLPFLIGVALIIGLLAYETWFKTDGLFHHDLFKKDRNFSITLFSIFVEGMAFLVANIYLPMEVSIVFETDPVKVNLPFCIVYISTIFCTIATSFYCSRTKHLRWPLAVSFGCFSLFYGLMMTVKAGSSLSVYLFPIILGIGFGGCLVVIFVAAHFSAPPELVSLSSGALTISRAVGGTVCLPIASAIFNSQITKYLKKDIASAVLPLGLSTDALPEFIKALNDNDNNALAAISGATPDIITAGLDGLKRAYVSSFRALYGFGLALSLLAFITACFLLDPEADFTMHVDEPLEEPVREISDK